MSTVEAWTIEYQKQGIPSSFRNEPSGNACYFVQFLLERSIHAKSAIDLGAGRGRNAFYLAKHGLAVEAIEFVSANAAFINQHAKEHDLKVKCSCQSVTDALPFESSSFDIGIDIFCYKHQTDKSLQDRYRQELSRILKPKGYFLLSLAGDDDGYYGPLLETSPDPKNKVIIDPIANVKSILYNRADFENEFKDYFDILDFQHKLEKGPMHGREYVRSTLNFIVQNRSKSTDSAK